MCMVLVMHHSWRMCGELGNGITSKIETHGGVNNNNNNKSRVFG